jgi:hypothetical protein
MDAPETPSTVGEPPRPSPDVASPVPAPPAPRPRPPHLGALYTSPGAPSVLVYFAEHHNLGMPLMPRWLEDAAEPAPGPIAEVLEPLEFEILYRTDGGKLIQATVRLDPASLPAPPGDWVVRTTGDWILRVSHAG